MASRVVLLGPQRFQPTLRDAVRELGVSGPVAVVTAGWQERERENDELRAHLDCEVVDLLLYHRYDDALLRDRPLAQALRRRQEELQQQQQLYRMRLEHALAAARQIVSQPEGAAVEGHLLAAIHAVRHLDRFHLRRLRREHESFEREWEPSRRVAVARHREQLAQLLDRCDLLAIAGGHVAVLLNRLRLFDLRPLIGSKPVVAWSAGAMAVSERVVLFHDSPPQGPGDPEVLDSGLGLCRGVVPLPHARQRLRLNDPHRVALFARRFAPAECVVLEGAARLEWRGERWSATPGTLRLGPDGTLREVAAS